MRPVTVCPSIRESQTSGKGSQQIEFIAQFKSVLLKPLTYYSVFAHPLDESIFANTKIVIGRGLSAIRSKTGNQAFLLQQLKDKFQEEDYDGKRAIFNAIRKTDLLGISLLIPTESVIDKFEEIVNLIFAELANLTLKNTNLRQTRDLLLPKLISGEIDVSELDIDSD